MAVKILTELGSVKISGVTRIFFRCYCEECGNEFTARKDHVTRKKNPIRSCGCNQHPITGRKAYNAKPEGFAAAKNVFNSYRTKCIKKKIVFEITFEDFIKITSLDCYYCGLPPEQEYSGIFKTGLRAGQKKVNGNYKYNGIDRIIPKVGYVFGNIRPCCQYCNISKSTRTEEQFYDWVQRIHNHLLKEKK